MSLDATRTTEISKQMSEETVRAYAAQILDLKDAGFTYREIDTMLDLPSAGKHAFSWRFMNDGRVKSYIQSM